MDKKTTNNYSTTRINKLIGHINSFLDLDTQRARLAEKKVSPKSSLTSFFVDTVGCTIVALIFGNFATMNLVLWAKTFSFLLAVVFTVLAAYNIGCRHHLIKGDEELKLFQTKCLEIRKKVWKVTKIIIHVATVFFFVCWFCHTYESELMKSSTNLMCALIRNLGEFYYTFIIDLLYGFCGF